MNGSRLIKYLKSTSGVLVKNRVVKTAAISGVAFMAGIAPLSASGANPRICEGSEKMLTYTAGAGGTITPPTDQPDYSCLSSGSVSVTAVPESGYEFNGWKVLYGNATITTPNNATTTISSVTSNSGVIADFKKTKTTADIIEPNIYIVIDDSEYMDSEIYYNAGTTKSDSDIQSLMLNYRFPSYDLATNIYMGGGKLEKCAGYNRFAFNPDMTYLSWDGYSNRFTHLDCDGATTSDSDLENTCPKLYPEKPADLKGSGCPKGSQCKASVPDDAKHLVARACKSDGCGSVVNISDTETYNEDMGSSIYEGGKCMPYPAYDPGKCESFKYFDCRPYGATGVIPSSVCGVVSWKNPNGMTQEWNPASYTCWTGQVDVRNKSCSMTGTGVINEILVIHEDDYKDASGTPLVPGYSHATALASANTACSALGGTMQPALSLLWNGGMVKSYANCGVVGLEAGDRPYPNIVSDSDRYRSSYSKWNDSSVDGEYDSSECQSVLSKLVDNEYIASESELKNYSNWFTYHRTRMHVVKGALLRAINELEKGRVTIALASAPGAPIVTMKSVSDPTEKQAIIDAIMDITPSYGKSAADLDDVYNDVVGFFDEDENDDGTGDNDNEKYQFENLTIPADPKDDTTAYCRQNHLIMINASSGSANAADAADLISSINTQFSSSDMNLCPSLKDNTQINAGQLNGKTGAPTNMHHLKVSIFDVSTFGGVSKVDTSVTTEPDASATLANAAFHGYGYFQRVFKQGDVKAGELPNIGNDLAAELTGFMLTITDSDHNTLKANCLVGDNSDTPKAKRVSWKELKRK